MGFWWKIKLFILYITSFSGGSSYINLKVAQNWLLNFPQSFMCLMISSCMYQLLGTMSIVWTNLWTHCSLGICFSIHLSHNQMCSWGSVVPLYLLINSKSLEVWKINLMHSTTCAHPIVKLLSVCLSLVQRCSFHDCLHCPNPLIFRHALLHLLYECIHRSYPIEFWRIEQFISYPSHWLSNSCTSPTGHLI